MSTAGAAPVTGNTNNPYTYTPPDDPNSDAVTTAIKVCVLIGIISVAGFLLCSVCTLERSVGMDPTLYSQISLGLVAAGALSALVVVAIEKRSEMKPLALIALITMVVLATLLALSTSGVISYEIPACVGFVMHGLLLVVGTCLK